MDEQQDEFHQYRMETVKELNSSKLDQQKEIARLDKEISSIKAKVLAISTAIGVIVNLIWGLATGEPASKPEQNQKPNIEQRIDK